MLLIVHACYCGSLSVHRSHSPFIWTQIHYWIHKVVFELDQLVTWYPNPFSRSPARYYGSRHVIQFPILAGEPVPCSYAQFVLGSSSDFLSIIRRALPIFMCFAPSTGSVMVKVGQRFTCHVWHFHVFRSHWCTFMSWWHHGIHQMHVLSPLGGHLSVHAMRCNIHRLVHYVFWALSCDVLTRVPEFQKSWVTSAYHVSHYGTSHGLPVHGEVFVLHPWHPCLRFATLATWPCCDCTGVHVFYHTFLCVMLITTSTSCTTLPLPCDVSAPCWYAFQHAFSVYGIAGLSYLWLSLGHHVDVAWWTVLSRFHARCAC